VQLRSTKRSRLALLASVDLARHPLELRSRQTIADAIGAASGTVADSLARLRRAGLVEAAAVRGGGYCLGRHPAEITLLDVLDASEAGVWARGCLLSGGPCDGSCALHPAWHEAQEAFRAALGAVTLAELARELP
jgi:Rrf2 family protein